MATLKKMVLASEFVIWPQTLDREARKQIHMTTFEDGSGHPEDGFLPLLGEHVGHLSHEEDEERVLGVSSQQRHVGDRGDVNIQEQRRHGDEVVNEEILVRGFELGVQLAKALGKPARRARA